MTVTGALGGALKQLVPVAVAVALVSAAQAQSDVKITTTKTATAGTVRAELYYQTETFSNPLGDRYYYQPRLRLIRSGRTIFDEALPTSGKDARLVDILGPEVRDLDGDGEPEVFMKIIPDRMQPGSTLIYRYRPASVRYVLESRPHDEKLEISRRLETRRVATTKNVQAELAFTEDSLVEGEVRLKLSRNGQLLLDSPLSLDDKEDLIASVDGPAVLDLDRDGEPEVMVNVFSRGAYCCAYSIIYHYVPNRKTYARLQHGWKNYRNQAALREIDKKPGVKFVSGNEDFSGEFGPYAISGARPLQIWSFRRGRLQDVTRSYPKLIRADAQNWWNEYHQEKSDWYKNKMPLTAYLADLHLLGEGRAGWRQVRQAYQAEDRREFFRQLRQALKKYGYSQ
jgi:hypothetical protein